MSTTTRSRESKLSLTAGQLPRFTWLALLVLAYAVTAGVLAVGSVMSLGAVVVIGSLLFLVAIFALSSAVEGRRKAVDRLFRYVFVGFFLLALAPLVSLVWQVVSKGMERFDLQYFTYSMRNVIGEGGGASHAIAGTLIVTGIATLISVPIGLLTAIFLQEYGGQGRLASSIRFFVDVMTGIPSIVAGLFAYTIFSALFGAGTRNGFSGAIALCILMIPTVVRSTEEMLRLVPNELREASYALGVPKFRTILKVVLPTSIAGIITGAVLAVARIIGETAPLLVTAGLNPSLNTNPFDTQMSTLPVFVYYQYVTPGIPQEPFYDRAWAGALTLILIVMGLNLFGRLLAWRFAPKPGR
ncbi:phosphate ABC transporter permease PstA [Tessaracoccus rhinocerotis]|uniref:Phosphate transport system permease protein PstA n=1 Tax=Tessaracoccus rhinocerotis TaxID=1689449 RepID=A0A553K1M1_9ACTN|nr:phosphate ABC transporter permease PstA [Tessaracoccus rhinocerotis]TRY18597.1 phosphate ABC transporter permease PstA [Tessaracoccus rhinocerotis]